MLNNKIKAIILDKLGAKIEVSVRYSNRAKNIAIRITSDGPELVVPDYQIQMAEKFLLTKETWVRNQVAKLQARSHVLIDHNIIPILGNNHELVFVDAKNNNVKIIDNKIIVTSSRNHPRAILIDFLKELLLKEISDYALSISAKHKLSYNQIKLMNNLTKWGSCSSRGVLSFHWRLVFAPKSVLEYLIIHEMSHLVEMNHSKRFWNLVEQLYPDYKAAQYWLKRNGLVLRKYLNNN
jgi:predicted metal-dependent hydrolase